MTRTPTPDRRLKTAIAGLTLLALATLAVLWGGDLWWRRGQALAQGERRAANLARILAAYLRETFEAADASLRQLAIHGRRVGGPGAAPAEWAAMLASARAGLTGIGSLSVTDAEGTIRHSTIAQIIGQPRRDEYVFRRLSADPRDVLVAGAPFVTLSKTLLIPLGRRLTRDEGAFDGIVVATFEPAEVRGFFQAVDVGRQGSLWVFHPDGQVLFREPSLKNPIGESAIGNPIFEAARRTGVAGSVRGPVREGGAPMLSAFHPVLDPQLVVAVSLDQGDVLAEWRRETAVSAGVLAALALGLAAVLLVLYRQVDARAEALQALTRAQRLESIGRLTGGVAHDFNNVLTVVQGNVYRLRKRGGADSHALNELEQAVERAASLTRQLLAFARRQPLQPRITDLNEMVRGLQPMLVRLVGEDITLKPDLAMPPCLANVDVGQAEAALMNLCANARDAMPQGGLIVVRTGLIALDAAYARQNAEVAPGRYVMVSVSDTGAGVPPEHLTRVFEPFFTTKDPGKGTGLGLSTVYGFVRDSGGHVKIYSEVGQGTSVKMYFPEAAGPAAAAEERRPAPEPRGSGETILLVEDERGVRELASEVLDELGYRVIAAADGPAALALARALPRIDLLFTDVVMPGGMNGRQLAGELERERPGLRVLYASGYSEDVIQHRGQVEPGLRLLAKPYGRDGLARAVHEALHEGRPPAL